MPSVNIYIDTDFYLALKDEAERNRKDLYPFITETLRQVCSQDEQEPGHGSGAKLAGKETPRHRAAHPTRHYVIDEGVAWR